MFVLVVALMAATEVRSLSRFRMVVGASLLAGAYPILTGLKQLIGGELVSKGDFSAVRGSFNFPNEFGVYLVLFLLIAIVALFELRSRWLKAATAVLAGAALLMLLHSYTRSAWIGFAVALVVLAFVQYRSLIAVAVLFLIVAAVGFPSAVRDVQARFGDLASQNAANSKNSLKWRRGQWSAMEHFGSDAPLVGQGFGSYRRKTVEEFGLEGRTYGTVQDTEQNGTTTRGFTAHNDLVKSWVETGAIGVLLWFATLVGLGVGADPRDARARAEAVGDGAPRRLDRVPDHGLQRQRAGLHGAAALPVRAHGGAGRRLEGVAQLTGQPRELVVALHLLAARGAE